MSQRRQEQKTSLQVSVSAEAGNDDNVELELDHQWSERISHQISAIYNDVHNWRPARLSTHDCIKIQPAKKKDHSTIPSSRRLHDIRYDTATMAAVPASETKSSLPAKDILPFDARQSEPIRLFPLSNYTFGTKETQPEEDPSVKDRLRRLEEYYDNHGMRRTGEGILVCHEHNHPHILMLQIANAFFKL
jgi:hypothetical protein